jgi:hypothetical protein
VVVHLKQQCVTGLVDPVESASAGDDAECACNSDADMQLREEVTGRCLDLCQRLWRSVLIQHWIESLQRRTGFMQGFGEEVVVMWGAAGYFVGGYRNFMSEQRKMLLHGLEQQVRSAGLGAAQCTAVGFDQPVQDVQSFDTGQLFLQHPLAQSADQTRQHADQLATLYR